MSLHVRLQARNQLRRVPNLFDQFVRPFARDALAQFPVEKRLEDRGGDADAADLADAAEELAEACTDSHYGV